MLAAADRLFATTEAPRAVSMDDIAAEAGVGKGTLFRAFGSRDGLLDALFAARLAPLRSEIERGRSQLGPAAPPLNRIVAILDEVLSFKFGNRHLMAARELVGSGLMQSPHYTWMRDTLRALIEQADPGRAQSATYTAHILLGGLRVDLLDDLLDSGQSPSEIRRDLTSLTYRVLGAAPSDQVSH